MFWGSGKEELLQGTHPGGTDGVRDSPSGTSHTALTGPEWASPVFRTRTVVGTGRAVNTASRMFLKTQQACPPLTSHPLPPGAESTYQNGVSVGTHGGAEPLVGLDLRLMVCVIDQDGAIS